jgi:hypothetical protein
MFTLTDVFPLAFFSELHGATGAFLIQNLDLLHVTGGCLVQFVLQLAKILLFQLLLLLSSGVIEGIKATLEMLWLFGHHPVITFGELLD